MRHWVFSCKKITALISLSMDTRLPLYKRMGIRFHLMMCRRCPALERSLRETIDVLRAMRDEPINVGADPEGDKGE